MTRAILFVEELAFDAIGIAFHSQRPVFQMRQKDGRDLDVVMNHLAFGEAGLRLKHLVEIRDREGATLDDQFSFLAHESKNYGITTADDTDFADGRNAWSNLFSVIRVIRVICGL